MCHGLPKQHPCHHVSVTWHYCPSADINLDTGKSTACARQTFAKSTSIRSVCINEECCFRYSGGRWYCCQCHQGPNTIGWCLSKRPVAFWHQNPVSGDWSIANDCDHGCCKNCKNGKAPNPFPRHEDMAS